MRNLESVVDAELRRRLESAQVDYCLIGASALAVHGYVRATADIYLLTLDDAVLSEQFWPGAAVTIRKGERDDPLILAPLYVRAPAPTLKGEGRAMRDEG